MSTIFGDFDISDFWEVSEYANESYIDSPLTDDVVSEIELRLGYRLPKSYIELSRHQNGGIPKNTNHRTTSCTSWADDRIAITGIYSIGDKKRYSLGGSNGSQFMIEIWDYPPIGIYFADCPSGGHDMTCLDYRECGRQGEPQVVHVDQEFDYKITFVAPNFESFIRGLEPEDAFEDNDDE
jgi:SMI1-KNR4 cell-wall